MFAHITGRKVATERRKEPNPTQPNRTETNRTEKSNAPNTRVAVAPADARVAPSAGVVALGTGASFTSHPKSNAYFRNSKRVSCAAASDSRARGDRSNFNAHRNRDSSAVGQTERARAQLIPRVHRRAEERRRAVLAQAGKIRARLERARGELRGGVPGGGFFHRALRALRSLVLRSVLAAFRDAPRFDDRVEEVQRGEFSLVRRAGVRAREERAHEPFRPFFARDGAEDERVGFLGGERRGAFATVTHIIRRFLIAEHSPSTRDLAYHHRRSQLPGLHAREQPAQHRPERAHEFERVAARPRVTAHDRALEELARDFKRGAVVAAGGEHDGGDPRHARRVEQRSRSRRAQQRDERAAAPLAPRGVVTAPTRARPSPSIVFSNGGTHHARHAVTAFPPPRPKHTTSGPPPIGPRVVPPSFFFVFSFFRFFESPSGAVADADADASSSSPPPPFAARSSSSSISSRSFALSAATSVPAAQLTESSRIASSVSASNSGATARSLRAPRRRVATERGTYRPLQCAPLFRSCRVAAMRNASSCGVFVFAFAFAFARRRSKMLLTSSKCSNAAWTSFTVCDSGSSQFAHRMPSTLSDNLSDITTLAVAVASATSACESLGFSIASHTAGRAPSYNNVHDSCVSSSIFASVRRRRVGIGATRAAADAAVRIPRTAASLPNGVNVAACSRKLVPLGANATASIGDPGVERRQTELKGAEGGY
eukprot:31356-Pelagococcus_subviridis.AAC.10